MFVCLLLWTGIFPHCICKLDITGVHKHYNFCMLILLETTFLIVCLNILLPSYTKNEFHHFLSSYYASFLYLGLSYHLGAHKQSEQNHWAWASSYVPIINGKAAKHSSLSMMFAEGLINSPLIRYWVFKFIKCLSESNMNLLLFSYNLFMWYIKIIGFLVIYHPKFLGISLFDHDVFFAFSFPFF